MAVCAFASLIFTSFIDVLSLVCVDPKYLNWTTSSSVEDGLGLMLLTIILLLSVLISRFCVDAICSRPEVAHYAISGHDAETFQNCVCVKLWVAKMGLKWTCRRIRIT